MPKELYDIRNYPRRSGTSQPQRRKPVLLGAEIKIDERTVADYVVFAQKLARHLTFYNENNIPQGNWEPFLKNDITYQLAVIASDKINFWNETWSELMEQVEGEGGGPAEDGDHKNYFTWRFDFLYTLVGKLVEAYAFSNSLPAWKHELVATCSSVHIEIIFSLLNQYFASASGFSLISGNAGTFTYKDITLVKKEETDQRFNTYDPWVTELVRLDTPLFPDTDFIFGGLLIPPEQIEAASEYLNELAAQLVNLYSRVIESAKKYLDITLNTFEQHQPHVGLFYAFLQLADEHRNEINGLLLKHLDFYYKQVLLVKEKSWEPDHAFVTFELAKNVSEFFIPVGTLLSAGKDSNKKDIYYKTEQDILVNKTELGEIRSFTIIKNTIGQDKNIRKNTLGIFGCNVANSLDGKGKPLPAGESWETFRADADNEKQIGISFYSALLHEAPGEVRHFAVFIQLSDVSLHDDLISLIQNFGTIRIETEKEPLFPAFNDVKAEGGLVKISFTIDGKTKLSKASPNASLIFGHKLEPVDDSFFGVIEMLQTARLVNLHIVLSAHEVKVTHVETAAGSTDLSSAFAAFGGVPKVGSSFSVIEPLLLNRKISNLKMNIAWEAKSERTYEVKISYPSVTDKPEPITKGDPVSEISLVGESGVVFTSDEIKIKLDPNDLGHADYANKMATAIIEFTRQ